MLEPNAVITDSLAPAVALSGLGMLIFGLNNRLMTIGSRVRDLNRELRSTHDPERVHNIRRQIPLFFRRAYLIRNAMFLLFAALGMMVFTAVAIALSRLDYVDWKMVPSWTFVVGLLLMLVAIIIEGYETSLNLKTLRLDIEHSLANVDHASNHSTE